jgi:hypothetical protein
MQNKNASKLRRQVTQFLSEFKTLVRHNPCNFKYNSKNDATLDKLEYTFAHCEEEFMGLEVKDYYSGPLDDYKGGQYWVFGKSVQGYMIYIKIKIHTKGDGTDIPYCLGFHFPDHSMNNFPLK